MVPASNPTLLLRLWRQFIADECPEEKQERIRRKRINNILLDEVYAEFKRRAVREGLLVHPDLKLRSNRLPAHVNPHCREPIL